MLLKGEFNVQEFNSEIVWFEACLAGICKHILIVPYSHIKRRIVEKHNNVYYSVIYYRFTYPDLKPQGLSDSNQARASLIKISRLCHGKKPRSICYSVICGRDDPTLTSLALSQPVSLESMDGAKESTHQVYPLFSDLFLWHNQQPVKWIQWMVSWKSALGITLPRHLWQYLGQSHQNQLVVQRN